MKTPRNLKSLFGILPSIVLLGLICAPVYGQWVKVPAAGTPRGPDGKPNLSAPAPRLSDGHSDLSGVWESGGGKYIQNIAADLKPGEVPFQSCPPTPTSVSVFLVGLPTIFLKRMLSPET